jgi:hypothetical protein
MIYGPHRKWAAASGILWALIDCLDKTTAAANGTRRRRRRRRRRSGSNDAGMSVQN